MKRFALALPMLAALMLLTGCVQDTASYMIDGDRNHSIMIMRSQDLPWGGVSLSVTAARQPDCLGGLNIKGAARDAEMVLHRAPAEYAEPIFILVVGRDYYAVSTSSCRVQKFDTPPADPGPEIGRFREVDGKFQYLATGR